MSDSAIQKLLRGEAGLPVMPAIAERLLCFREQGDKGLDDLADIVSLDVAIASTLLRYANSPAYKLGAHVERIERAVVVMGYKAVMDIALSLSLARSMSEQAGNGLDYRLFWQRSLITAAAARVLGEIQRESALEELFLAGLLQDIGLLALDRVRPGLYGGVSTSQRDHSVLRDREEDVLGFDHAKFGAALLQQWGLHERTVAAVMASHRDHTLSDDTFASCVAAAGDIADFFLLGGGSERYARVQNILYRYFSIRQSQCMQLLVKINHAIHGVAGVYADIVQSAGDIRFALPETSPVQQPVEEAIVDSSFEALCCLQDPFASVELEGVISQAAFENTLKNSLKMLRGQPISVALLSLDNLRSLADERGSKVVELLLRVVSRKLQEHIRVEDFVTRYGTCFAIILLGSRAEDATRVIERVVELFVDARYALANGDAVSLSVSAGVAGSSERMHFDCEGRLLNGAAEALSNAGGAYRIGQQVPESHLASLVH